MLLGGLLGLVAYATFDLTSLAVFRDFPVRLALIDMSWGTCMTAVVSAGGYLIGRWLGMGDS